MLYKCAKGVGTYISYLMEGEACEASSFSYFLSYFLDTEWGKDYTGKEQMFDYKWR